MIEFLKRLFLSYSCCRNVRTEALQNDIVERLWKNNEYLMTCGGDGREPIPNLYQRRVTVNLLQEAGIFPVTHHDLDLKVEEDKFGKPGYINLFGRVKDERSSNQKV